MSPHPEAGQLVSATLRLLRPLGEGGMGSVWVAEHLALRSHVVVKFMAEELASTKEAVARFSREAAAAAQVRSPHVVQTLDYGVTVDGVPFIVLELLEGRDLARHLELNGPLPPREVADIITQLARALTKVHEAGIVHRDIKPNNIFLCDAGDGAIFVKLLDFGVAKSTPQAALAAPLGTTTNTGAILGTPYYMSPEQIMGAKTLDYRSDLWAVGVVVFEALTGIKPFEGETVGGIAVQILRDPLPVPSRVRPDLPASLDRWFDKACARPVEERFGSAKEMAEALAVALQLREPSTASARFASSEPSVTSGEALAPTAMGCSTPGASIEVVSEKRAGRRPRLFVPVVVLAAVLGGGGTVLGISLSRSAQKTMPRAEAALVAPSATLPVLASEVAPLEVLPAVASSASALPAASHQPPAGSASARPSPVKAVPASKPPAATPPAKSPAASSTRPVRPPGHEDDIW